MKISVITRHAIINYGSILQALATQSVIEKIGHECEIINYIRDDESYKKLERTILKCKPEWNKNILKRMMYLFFRVPETILAGKRFEKERMRLLKLSRLYTDSDELQADPPPADVYITGSDQVWGPMTAGDYDCSYCLSFTVDNAKRISYAASFGHTDMTSELEEYFKKHLSRYAGISVREESAVKILADMGIAAQQVIDPTLLIDSKEWMKYADMNIKGKYVLVYQLHNDPKLGIYAQKTAKEKGLPLIRISASLHQISRRGKFIWCPDISKFLGYIKNAEYLVTDSFHGTAFAINFNTQFIEVLPNNKTGTRNISILKLTELEDRIVTDFDDFSCINRQIDFQRVNRIIETERERSLKILKRMLEE